MTRAVESPDLLAGGAAGAHVEGVDEVGRIETHGIDYIPESERHSSPWNLTWVYIGAQLGLGIIVIGWLPIAFGLSWWSAFTAITIGVLVGSIIVAPMALFGPRTGTNGPVSSGAHFGVRGRLIGSALALLASVGSFALGMWAGGQASVAAANDLFGLPQNDYTLGIAYAVIVPLTVAIATYGHANIVLAQKLLVPTIGLMLVIGVVVFADDFDPGYQGGEYLLGGYWSTWSLAMVVALSLPVSYGPFVNDFARHISARRWSPWQTMLGLGLGQFVGCWLALTFGAFVATLIPAGSDFVTGLIEVSPSGYAVVLVLVAALGALGQCFCAYATGLDLSSIVPVVKRVPATLFLGIVGLAVVVLGTLVWNIVDSLSAFVLILVVLYTPWMAILMVGYVLRRGRYRPQDLQVFNRRERGGAYWFTGGWNLRAVVAWIAGAVVGMLFIQTTLTTGPLAQAAEGIDLSFLSSGIVGAALYYAFVKLFPES